MLQPRTPLELEVAAVLNGNPDDLPTENSELTPAEERALAAMSLEEVGHNHGDDLSRSLDIFETLSSLTVYFSSLFSDPVLVIVFYHTVIDSSLTLYLSLILSESCISNCLLSDPVHVYLSLLFV